MKRVFIIAEAGVNHNGSLALAKKLVRAAASAGANAVKFQTFRAENLVTRDTPQAKYQLANSGRQTSQFAMLKKLELTEAMHHELARSCDKLRIKFISTPFDSESLEFLTSHFKLSCLKIPSGEITNAPFLLKIAQKGLPVILSTGMSTVAEIRQALGVLAFGFLNKPHVQPGILSFQAAYRSPQGKNVLKKKVTILHCVSEYPAPLEQVNLNVIPKLAAMFKTRVGYSDHTLGINAAIAAVSLGATVIEKHLTLSRRLPGVDHKASLEPKEFENMVDGIREVEVMLGNTVKSPQPCEIKNIAIVRKRLVAKEPVKKNELFTENNLTAKRSLKGRSPLDFWKICGSLAKRNYKADEAIL